MARTLKTFFGVFIDSILAGFSITIGATVLLSLITTNKVMGTFLFGYGLFAVITFKFWLYTGKIGFVLEKDAMYLLELLVCLFGNFVGDLILAIIIKQSRIGKTLEEQSQKLIDVKQADDWYSIFILAMMCGFMIFFAVKGHAVYPKGTGKAIFNFLAIMIFILCSYEHCIANGVYYVYAGHFSGKKFGYLMLMVIGNSVGSIILEGLLMLTAWCNKVEEPPKTEPLPNPTPIASGVVQPVVVENK